LADEQEARLRAQTNLKEIEKKYASLKEKYLALQTSVGAAAVPIRRIPSGGQLQEDVADVIEDEGEEENLPKWQDLYNPVDLSTTSPPQWKLRCTVPVSVRLGRPFASLRINSLVMCGSFFTLLFIAFFLVF
jgi:hypothetical protein